MHHDRIAGAAVVFLLATGGCAPKTNGPGAHPADSKHHLARPSRSLPSAAAAAPSRTVSAGAGDDEAVATLAAASLDRGDLIAAVLERNPTLTAMRETWKAARQRPAQVAALDDPTASYGFAPLSIGSRRVDFGETAEVAQRFPWPGKLRLRGAAAAYEADVRGHDYEAMRHEIALSASDLFDDYFLVERALEINAEHVLLLEDFEHAATAQYAAGRLSQQDPIQAEVELAHLAHREVVLSTERRVIIARLNALLHRRPAEPLPSPERSRLPDGLGKGLSARVGRRLQDLAIESRPELAAIAAEIAARKADTRLATLQGYPDFGVMASYNSMWSADEHRWMAGLSVSLPLWRERIRAARSEAAARLAAAEARRQAGTDEVRSSVHQAFERLREAHHVRELYRSRLLPAARDQVRAARAGVGAGTNSFLALIDAEKNLRDVELGYEETRASVQHRLARLARHAGRFPHEAAELLSEAGVDAAVPRGMEEGEQR